MYKFTHLPDDIIDRIPGVQAFLDSELKVVFAYLFGSLAKGKKRPLSDVDIAVYLAENSDPARVKLGLLGHLIELLETDEIDLVILNTASLPLKARILENKFILADKEPFLRHRFESLTMRKYFDFSIKETSMLKGRYGLG